MIRFAPDGADHEAARRLLEHPSKAYVDDRVRAEIALLVDRKAKVELDALANDDRLLAEYLRRSCSIRIS